LTGNMQLEEAMTVVHDRVTLSCRNSAMGGPGWTGGRAGIVDN